MGVTNIGSQHPLPENIPHIHNAPVPGEMGSPAKEQSHLHSSPMASEEPVTAESVAAEEAAEEEARKEAEKTVTQG